MAAPRVDTRFVRGLSLACYFVASLSWAQAVVAIVDAQNVLDSTPKRVQRACESALSNLTSLTVGEGPGYRKGAPRKCADDCTKDLLKTLPPYVVALTLEGKGDRLTIEGSLWADGRKMNTKRVEGAAEALDPLARSLLETLMPTWARRGWAAVVVPDATDVTVKVDGRPLSGAAGTLVAVTAGKHAIDVLGQDGRALLTRMEAKEGSKGAIETSLPPLVLPRTLSTAGITPVRVIGYTSFLLGALAVASGFIAGAIGRWSVADLRPCMPGANCAPLDMVQARAEQANTITTTGNVLLGVGAGLAALGVGLFVFDVVTE